MNIPNEWVEKGARAIFERKAYILAMNIKWEDTNEIARDHERDTARRAIEAALPDILEAVARVVEDTIVLPPAYGQEPSSEYKVIEKAAKAIREFDPSPDIGYPQ